MMTLIVMGGAANTAFAGPSSEYRLPDSSCGPACLYWVSRYFGKPTEFGAFVGRCADPAGCSVAEMRDIAMELGLSVRVLEMSQERFAEFSAPAIILERLEGCEVGHYALVMGTGDASFLRVDTVDGVQTVRLGELTSEQRRHRYPTLLVADRPELLNVSVEPSVITPNRTWEFVLAGVILIAAGVIGRFIARGQSR